MNNRSIHHFAIHLLTIVVMLLLCMESTTVHAGESIPEVDSHWAFEPLQNVEVPKVEHAGWAINSVDRFVQAKLSQAGLKPNEVADRRTLLRRVYFDLTGLPPTFEQVRAFEADKRPDAYERIVEQLLSSPAYGERWGRHWLDIARYADTHGDIVGRDNIAPHNYTFRDYIIRSFNADVPYDQMIREQLAADHLLASGKVQRPALAGLGFVTVGRRFLNNNHDTIDDRIDVAMRGFMSLTVACARCHDHKYDPIPTADYYSLYGIFASSTEPAPPLIGIEPDPIDHAAYLAEQAARQQVVDDFQDKKLQETVAKFVQQSGTYLRTAHELKSVSDNEQRAKIQQERKLVAQGVSRWTRAIDKASQQHDPVLYPFIAFAKLDAASFGDASAELTAAFDTEGELAVHPHVHALFDGSPPASLAEVAQRYRSLFLKAHQASAKQESSGESKDAAADPQLESIREWLLGDDGPCHLTRGQLFDFLELPDRTRLTQLNDQVKLLDATHRGAPDRAPVLTDAGTPRDAAIFLRGDPQNRGEVVPRRFIKILSDAERTHFDDGSGRLQLADAIASPTNPLTSRTIVNRVWLQHFGQPLVATTDDFGLRSDPPSHPQLLDWLAAWFVDPDRGNWSLKKLHRLLVHSATYRQSSMEREALAPHAQIDPENRLLWRMNRKRLELEPMRDSLLAVSGELSTSMFGKPVRLTQQPFPLRRSVYGFIDRQEIPPLFQHFDVANPDVTTAERYATTVPQQALFFMNSPFVIQRAQALTRRLHQQVPEANIEQKTAQLYQWVFQRQPMATEMETGVLYLQSLVDDPDSASDSIAPWTQYAQALLLSNEFLFID